MTTSWLPCTIRPTCSAYYAAYLKRILAPISILHPDGPYHPLHKGGLLYRTFGLGHRGKSALADTQTR